MKYAENEQIEAVIISLDFEKAFDRVEIPALISALEYFNFGNNFMKLTTVLCTNFKYVLLIVVLFLTGVIQLQDFFKEMLLVVFIS